jgi:hypothetical protein
MGASASTNKNTSNTSITEDALNKCPSVTASNTMDIKNFTHDPPATCKDSTTEFNQNATVDATCVIQNMQSSLANKLMSADAKAKTGIGISASTNIQETETNIAAKVENSCGEILSSNQISFDNINIRSCNFKSIQNTNAKSRCIIDSLQKMDEKLQTESGASAEGLTLGGWFGGLGIIVAVVVIFIVAVIGFIAYKFLSSGDDDDDYDDDYDQEGGFSMSELYTSSVGTIKETISGMQYYKIIVASTIIIVMLLIFMNTKKNIPKRYIN